MAQDQKLQAIRVAMDQIEKQYGKGSIMKFGDQNALKIGTDVISTGIIPELLKFLVLKHQEKHLFVCQ